MDISMWQMGGLLVALGGVCWLADRSVGGNSLKFGVDNGR
jgi:hypothetical protein